MHVDLDFKDIKVLIVGDVMIDRYMIGDIYRQSPEADIPVLENIRIENRLGGAANVALNIKSLGATPYLCGIIGNDENKDIFKNEMSKMSLSTQLLIEDDSRKTTVKTRVISNNKHIVRVDMEDTHNITDSIENSLFHKIETFLKNHTIDILIYQDYNKGLLTKTLIRNLQKLTKKHNIITAVDPKNTNFFEYKGVDIFKPNRREIEVQLGTIKKLTKTSLDKIAKEVRALNNAKHIIITLSEDGVYYNNIDESSILPIIKGDVVDVSGAGDSVLSIICLAYTKRYDMSEIMILANIVGNQVCGLPGVQPINLTMLKSQLRQFK